MVDAHASGACPLTGMEVQVLSSALCPLSKGKMNNTTGKEKNGCLPPQLDVILMLGCSLIEQVTHANFIHEFVQATFADQEVETKLGVLLAKIERNYPLETQVRALHREDQRRVEYMLEMLQELHREAGQTVLLRPISREGKAQPAITVDIILRDWEDPNQANSRDFLLRMHFFRSLAALLHNILLPVEGSTPLLTEKQVTLEHLHKLLHLAAQKRLPELTDEFKGKITQVFVVKEAFDPDSRITDAFLEFSAMYTLLNQHSVAPLYADNTVTTRVLNLLSERLYKTYQQCVKALLDGRADFPIEYTRTVPAEDEPSQTSDRSYVEFAKVIAAGLLNTFLPNPDNTPGLKESRRAHFIEQQAEHLAQSSLETIKLFYKRLSTSDSQDKVRSKEAQLIARRFKYLLHDPEFDSTLLQTLIAWQKNAGTQMSQAFLTEEEIDKEQLENHIENFLPESAPALPEDIEQILYQLLKLKDLLFLMPDSEHLFLSPEELQRSGFLFLDSIDERAAKRFKIAQGLPEEKPLSPEITSAIHQKALAKIHAGYIQMVRNILQRREIFSSIR